MVGATYSVSKHVLTPKKFVNFFKSGKIYLKFNCFKCFETSFKYLRLVGTPCT